jgi:prophage antirepressor-like protein
MPKPLAPLSFTFQDHPIRCVGTDRDLWFVAQDVVESLGVVWKGRDSLASLPADWISLRNLRTHVRQRDGTYRVAMVDVLCLNEAGVYKLAFRSNKPEADAFTNWVASEVIPSVRRTGSYTSARRTRYERQGRQLEWIDQREEGIEARKTFTDTLKDHGVQTHGYAVCTDEINKPLLGGTAKLVKVQRGLKPKATLRDSLSTVELAEVKLAELWAAKRIEEAELAGNDQCATACRLTGNAVAIARTHVDATPLGN